MSLPLDPFDRVRLPESVAELRRDLLHAEAVRRLHRVALRLAKSAHADDREVALALLTWFAEGGRASRLASLLGVVGRKGRHRVRLPHAHEDNEQGHG